MVPSGTMGVELVVVMALIAGRRWMVVVGAVVRLCLLVMVPVIVGSARVVVV